MIEISENEYRSLADINHVAMESFTDMDGTMSDCPQYFTVWGDGDRKIIKFEAKQEKGVWIKRYFKY